MNPVVLITGAAKRIGAAIAEYFHTQQYRVIIHYRHSKTEAEALAQKLNARTPSSATAIYADLDNFSHYQTLIQQAITCFGRLDALINNASTFFKTPMGKAGETEWNALINSNLKAPFFIAQASAPELKKQQGSIINIVDIHAEKPLKNFPIYTCAKAGLRMLTKSLALELAPDVRVNGIAPGHVLWPTNPDTFSVEEQKNIMETTPLQRAVDPNDIAKTAYFLVENHSITGQVINIDGGRATKH
ncbi:MAG: pteridine reductase [Gammaproteobacteria bacterium RIFCSPHIGHO2_12_FULL_42_13]|nr:MAG: pteridine reductase [Gammaproteobacteria bacterium RIFCSPHIGHO2_12_FULL_42_13]